MELVERVRETIAREGLLVPGDTLVVGVSGGPDSLCLLHVLRALAPEHGVALHVAHLHHGLRGAEADADARFVQELVCAWDLPCTLEYADVPTRARERRIAIEEAARQARYAFLGALARALGGRSVAVAHHADDQVETVLMHFLRGSGLAGLRGMRPLSWMDELRLGEERPDVEAEGRIRLLRPLLRVSRSEIMDYCRAHALQPRFDRSNLDQTYFRNRLRHELIPLLETYNPNLREVVQRTAEVLAGDYDLLRAQWAGAWEGVVRAASEEFIVYDLAALRALPVGLQRSLIREGIHRLRQSLRNIHWAHVDAALAVLRAGHAGAEATLPQGLALRLGYTQALLAAEDYAPPLGEDRPRLVGEPLALGVPGVLRLPGDGWVFTTRLIARDELPQGWERNPDPYCAYLDAARLGPALRLRRRQEGDWFCPLGLGGRRQKLRDFYSNIKLPRTERASVPLLVAGDKIAWVVGWRVDVRYAIGPATEHVLVVCLHSTGGQDSSDRS